VVQLDIITASKSRAKITPMDPIVLKQIFIYPVKSLAGISSSSAKITPLGLEYDRRWMIIDNQGRFITQRLYPQLSLIGIAIESGDIVLTSPDGSSIRLPLSIDNGPIVSTRVWRDTVEACVMAQAQNEWISQYLDRECRFVYMPDKSIRSVDQEYARSENDRVSFADGYPFLLISQASLDDLNQRLQAKNEAPVPILRFRPNLLVQGCEAYAEDNWQSFRIGDNLFHGVKPCSRCIMTTVDPATGKKGREPLDTLMQYRKRGNQAYFGQNVLLDLDFASSFILRTGEQVQIVASG
jgi:uncharacterized protein YcbX